MKNLKMLKNTPSLLLALALFSPLESEAKELKKSWWKIGRKPANAKMEYVPPESPKEEKDSETTEATTEETQTPTTSTEASPDKPQKPKRILWKVPTPRKGKEAFKKWALQMDLGFFDPNLGQWGQYYDDNNPISYGLEASYYLEENWSLSLGFRYIKTSGHGVLSQTGNIGAEIDHQQTPYRFGIQYEKTTETLPWLRPYASLGYVYTSYKQTNPNGAGAKGHADGYSLNGGVMINFYQFKNLQSEDSFKNIYWVFDLDKSWVKAGSSDIGGLQYSLGLQTRF